MSKSVMIRATGVVLGFAALSCGSTSSGPAGPEVTVSNFQFTPSQLTVKAGETVTWHFTQGIHNVVSGPNCASDGKFTSGDPKAASYDYSKDFVAPGTYEYYCAPHCQSQGMKATIIVQ